MTLLRKDGRAPFATPEIQGSLLFEDAECGEECSDLGSISTESLSDIGCTGDAEKPDRGVAQCRHDFGTGALPDPACVLPQRDVAHVM